MEAAFSACDLLISFMHQLSLYLFIFAWTQLGDFVKNPMFINPGVFDERVLQIRSSKTPAFIAIQFRSGLADSVPN